MASSLSLIGIENCATQLNASWSSRHDSRFRFNRTKSVRLQQHRGLHRACRSSLSARLRNSALSITSPQIRFGSQRHGSNVGETVDRNVFSSPNNCVSGCVASRRKQRGYVGVFVPRAFYDKSSFQLSKHKMGGSFEERLSVPRATVGPEEPHAASTAWPDGVTEKQEFSTLGSDLELLQLEGFLGSELPSHPNLHRGELKNGLRYLILPNKVPLKSTLLRYIILVAANFVSFHYWLPKFIFPFLLPPRWEPYFLLSEEQLSMRRDWRLIKELRSLLTIFGCT